VARRKSGGIAAFFLAALLAGCTAPVPREPVDALDWETHRRALASLERWSFSGRVAVKYTDGADSARLSWRQAADDLEMTVSGPGGFKQATLILENNRLSLLRDGQWQPLDQYEDPLASEFGWTLPLDYLPWWLRGLPAPQVQAGRSKLELGRLSLLVQAGWTVEYPEYQWVQGWQLPRIIRFRRDDVEGKILLKNWVLEL
jgi:outer membrane lipoprotein LolB